MKVVLAGKGLMLGALIEGCLACGGVDVVGVLRYENLISPRWRLKLADFFKPSVENTLIKKYGLQDLSFKSMNSPDFRRFLLKNNVDLLLVGTWREKLQRATFEVPKLATVNVHPSLLPRYRGPNPYLQVIKHQEMFSGFTFHLVDEGFDSGAILYQKRVDIEPYYTSKELRERTVYEVRKALPEFLVALDKGEIIPVEQNSALASYFPNIKEEEMMLDFSSETAAQIVVRVKALHPWLPCYVAIGDDFYVVNPYDLRVIENCEPGLNLLGDRLFVRCCDGRGVDMRVEKWVRGKKVRK